MGVSQRLKNRFRKFLQRPGTTVDLAFEPILNEYNGRTSVELEVKDLQFPGV